MSAGPKKPSSASNKSAITLRTTTRKATRTVQSIYERIEELVTFPNRGRIGRREGTRELVLAPLPYIAVYRVKEFTIEILQIRHGAQDWQ